MRFTVDQPLDVTRSVAEQALVDPDFYSSLGAMGSIGAPEVLARQESGRSVRLSVRYRFAGNLARPARAVLDPDKMTWVIESVMHLDEHRAEFEMLPDHYADRLECSGRYRFEERGRTAAQVIDGDLVVHYPLVAKVVERAIVMGLRQNMAEQADLIARWARSRSSPD